MPDSTYDRSSTGQGNNPPQENDLYVPHPTAVRHRVHAARGYGRRFAIKMGPSGGNEISSGWFRTLDLPRADTTQMGNATVQTNILSCNGLPSGFAGPTTVCPASIDNTWEAARYWAERGCYRVQTGATVGSTRNAVEELMALDWSGPMGRGTGNHRQHLRPAGN